MPALPITLLREKAYAFVSKKNRGSNKKTVPPRRRPALTGGALAAKNADEGKSQQALAWAQTVLAAQSASAQSVSTRSPEPDDLSLAGHIYFRFAKYALAAECFQRLGEQFPGDPSVDFHRAFSLAAVGQTNAAIAAVEAWLPTCSHLEVLQLAHYLELGGGVSQAIELLDNTKEQHTAPEISLELGRLLGNSGERERAIDLLSEGLRERFKTTGHRGAAWFFIGVFLDEQGAAVDDVAAAYRASIA